MAVLFRCDQCSYEEWREASQEPWLCAVCGWMRWRVVAEEEAGGGPDWELIVEVVDDSSDETDG